MYPRVAFPVVIRLKAPSPVPGTIPGVAILSLPLLKWGNAGGGVHDRCPNPRHLGSSSGCFPVSNHDSSDLDKML